MFHKSKLYQLNFTNRFRIFLPGNVCYLFTSFEFQFSILNLNFPSFETTFKLET